MKFQNPSLKFFLNGRTDTRTHKPKPICSPLFQNWGHNDVLKDSFILEMDITNARIIVSFCTGYIKIFQQTITVHLVIWSAYS